MLQRRASPDFASHEASVFGMPRAVRSRAAAGYKHCRRKTAVFYFLRDDSPVLRNPTLLTAHGS